ncbi:unnamed protein product [Paramecium sonneborni]|uniref:Uncharacterized protein n=1 Tax=Paramecium sonneborni TaxID=65129 RepID=A0A8S1K2B5_9CILI|nr:unnamed protein product [Paramecium sonneborni]
MFKVYPLGSGQEVGRSCIILTIYDKTIMLDCGLHMTHQDNRRFPDFQLIEEKLGRKYVDLVLITHFHLDHCGALPYFTELYGNGYNGPIVMSMPTKALLPYMLEDYRRIWTMPKEEQQPQQQTQQDFSINPQVNTDPLLIYDHENIKSCVSKVQVIGLYETQNFDGIEVTAYYAGHLLGACMFHVKYKNVSVVYTGDYNSIADRHLGGAYIDQLQPDLVISESTYATIIRDSKRTRERNFLMHVQEVLDRGGKVLIPVFALGRAQELSVLLESYWQRTKCKAGLYYAAGLIEKANQYYKIFTGWESEKIQQSFLDDNIFNFKYIQPFDRNLIKSPLSMVLLATPGMLHGGLSMQVFKEWCGCANNSLVIPGYCVPGTLGNKLLAGIKLVRIDNKDYDIKMQINNMSFSAHADSRGIIQLVNHLQPKSIAFVHGEYHRMKTLGAEIIDKIQIRVDCPANFELLEYEKIMSVDRPLTIKGDFKKFMNGYLLEHKGQMVLLSDENDIMKEVNQLLGIMQSEQGYMRQYKITGHLL